MIDFTLYPNLNGQLGQNKVAIPDGVTTFWPDGDALVGNFIYKDGKLSGLVDTKALIANDSHTTTFPYDYVNIAVDKSLEDTMIFERGSAKYFTVTFIGSYNNDNIVFIRFEDMDEDTKTMFRSATKIINNTLYDNTDNEIGKFNTKSLTTGTNIITNEIGMPIATDGKPKDALLTTIDMETYSTVRNIPLIVFNSDLSSLTNAKFMFQGCDKLTTFTSNLDSLTSGTSMFNGCLNLTTFDIDMTSLTDGRSMFHGCNNLESFSSDLQSLDDGESMFGNCTNLSTLDIKLGSLTNGNFMFRGCDKLISFNDDLSTLLQGEGMFMDCYNLKSFNSNLKSLTNGFAMFMNCKLDSTSIQSIADTIKDVRDLEEGGDGPGPMPDVIKRIDISIENTTPSELEHIYFSQIQQKGWNVYVNGSENSYTPSTITTDETGEIQKTPIPFWAKPIPSEKKRAKYVDENGNYYNILGGQFIYVNDPESYGMFMNEEDAAMQMRLTRIEKEEV